MELKTQTDKSLQIYKTSIDVVNNLIKIKKEQYGNIVQSMLQIEESRAGFVQTLVAKHIKLTEYLSKIYLERCASMSSAVSGVNTEGDIKEFVKGRKRRGRNILFSPLKFIQYEAE